uniref:Phosphoribosyltransferase domain-containing protein n=1 Tax=Globodera rostochiensis TaxID=31243 RepID=A0A914GTK5_GLORO
MEESAERRALVVEDGAGHPLSLFSVPDCYCADIDSVLIPHGLIHDRIRQLATEIHREIGDRPLVLICLLKGAYRFFAVLAEWLAELRLTCNSGLSSIDGSLGGANVLLVDDIFDTGLTMSRVVESLNALTEPGGRIWTAVLLTKRTPRRRKDALREDFVAFSIPDRFVVGFGMDYNQRFRDLSHICVISQSGIAKYKSGR